MEALAFYDSYFEEAGELNEPIIIRELGSPAKVAKSIKIDLGALEEEESGAYTERGYQDNSQRKDSIMKLNEVVTPEQEDKKEENQAKATATKETGYQNQGSTNQSQGNGYQNQGNGYQNQNNGYQNQSNGYQNESANYQNQNTGYQNQNRSYQNHNTTYQNQNTGHQNPNAYQNQRPVVKKTGINLFALILLCIFGFPIIIPLLIACFATVFGLVVGFGGAGIGCIVAGFALFVMGVTKIFVLPLFGALSVGGGLICFGIGALLFLVACLCAKMFPILIRGFVSLLKAPFGGRSVAA